MKPHYRRIAISSQAVRFHVKDGWTFEEVEEMAEKGSRIIYFKDEYPYFIADRLNADKVLEYKPIPSYAFKEDAKNTTRENIEMRNL